MAARRLLFAELSQLNKFVWVSSAGVLCVCAYLSTNDKLKRLTDSFELHQREERDRGREVASQAANSAREARESFRDVRQSLRKLEVKVDTLEFQMGWLESKMDSITSRLQRKAAQHKQT